MVKLKTGIKGLDDSIGGGIGLALAASSMNLQELEKPYSTCSFGQTVSKADIYFKSFG